MKNHYNNEEIYEKVLEIAEKSLKIGKDYDGQECYLGYDPETNLYIMGFDLWPYFEEGMVLGVIEFSFGGGKIKIVGSSVIEGEDGFYPYGLEMIEGLYPQIEHLRLD